MLSRRSKSVRACQQKVRCVIIKASNRGSLFLLWMKNIQEKGFLIVFIKTGRREKEKYGD